jgi:glycosyltransferase involved in cell wall biosynthesis
MMKPDSDSDSDSDSFDVQASNEHAELEAMRAQLQASEARYTRAARDLNRMRQAFARAGGSAYSREVLRLRKELATVHRSTIWRASAPLRFLLDTIRRPRAAATRIRTLHTLVLQSAATDGWPATLKKIEMKVRRKLGRGRSSSGNVALAPLERTGKNASSRIELRVLLIAETTLPQCFKYRVLQKQRMIEHLGYTCTITSWREPEICMRELQTHAVAIFYRTPSFPEVMRMIDEARQLGVPTLWEVDDLIFDAERYATNANLRDLTTAEMEHLLRDAEHYRKAMLACDGCIASTPALAQAMLESGAKQAHVIENALDVDTLRIAEAIDINATRLKADDMIRIVYGSGTRTHDTDFRQIAPAIVQILEKYSSVKLRIVGSLKLGPELDAYAARVERFPLSDYATYLGLLAECDINIAPLESSVFSDAKSNVKFLEGAIVGLPSVCSPRSAFRAAITSGLDSILADGVEQWFAGLETLVRDPQLRQRMGDAARKRAIDGYGHLSIAATQVQPLLKQYEQPTRPPLRVLAVNIFFAPQSFGGATVVAEEMAKAMSGSKDVEYSVFTSLPTDRTDAYQVVRYDAKGSVVFGMGLPPESDWAFDYDNPQVYTAFMDAVRAIKPDVVHVHCVQGMGVGLLDICQAEGIPYVVTLHDAWWICARQFMITPAMKYCHQKTINLDVCNSLCVSRVDNEPRQERLKEALAGAAMLLSPSKFFRDLYIQNGFDRGTTVVNKNGVKAPMRARSTSNEVNRRLRFGYVGGDSHIKGAHLLKKFFASTPYTNYELAVVDNTLNLGMSSISTRLWACTGTLKVIPAYTQDTIDEFFDGIDVLLFPTQWKESFGLTVREALIRDVWVVATDAGGVAEDIVDGENGSIVDFDDSEAGLNAVLTGMLAEPSRYFRHVNPYASRIRTFEQQAAELVDLLRSVKASANP